MRMMKTKDYYEKVSGQLTVNRVAAMAFHVVKDGIILAGCDDLKAARRQAATLQAVVVKSTTYKP